MPPAIMRRPVMITVWIVLAAFCVVFSPLLAVAALVASVVTRRPQPMLIWHFFLSYLWREMVVLLACGGLWLASGMGLRLRSERFQRAHYRLLCWLLDGVLSKVLSTLRLNVRAEPSPEAEQALAGGEPLLLFSRHAGPGDSLVIVHQLMTRFGRRPRIVMKRSLALDPCIDLICHRLPNAMLDTSDREECEVQIRALAHDLGPRGVLVLFPEGGNFTPERRRRAILRLWRRGQGAQASRAERLEHVMPPKPAGALAALAGNPAADVVFAAHTGLGHQAFAGDLWRELPRNRTMHMRMWLSSAGERPSDPDQRLHWLYRWWERLDAWIEEQGEPVPDSPCSEGRARTPPA